VGLREPNLGGN